MMMMSSSSASSNNNNNNNCVVVFRKKNVYMALLVSLLFYSICVTILSFRAFVVQVALVVQVSEQQHDGIKYVHNNNNNKNNNNLGNEIADSYYNNKRYYHRHSHYHHHHHLGSMIDEHLVTFNLVPPTSSRRNNATKKHPREEEEEMQTTTTAKETPSPSPSPPPPTRRRISRLAKMFYENHREQINRLINQSTALDWDARSKAPFGPFKEALGEENLSVVPWKVGPDFRLPLVNRTDILNNNNSTTSPAPRYIVWRDICLVAKAFKREQQQQQEYANNRSSSSSSLVSPLLMPHVLILRLNENWGEFSTYIENRTTKSYRYRTLTGPEAWNKKGCKPQDIMDYLNNPNLRAAVTTQHQLLSHPKVHSLPLGIKSFQPDLQKLLATLNNNNNEVSNLDDDMALAESRPQLLMINSAPHAWRIPILNNAIENFNNNTLMKHYNNGTFRGGEAVGVVGGGVKNTYGKQPYQKYLNEMRRSKFILSPSGLGLDCYRHYEAIYMGTIPVLEHLNRTSDNDGWFRTLQDLPVAWIDNYNNLTPEWLEKKYLEIISKGHSSYKYQKLTRQWWIQKIQSTLL